MITHYDKDEYYHMSRFELENLIKDKTIGFFLQLFFFMGYGYIGRWRKQISNWLSCLILVGIPVNVLMIFMIPSMIERHNEIIYAHIQRIDNCKKKGKKKGKKKKK